MEVGVRWSKFLWQTSDFQAAADMADRVVEQAEVSGNLYFVARGHFHSGMALFKQDQFELASEHLDMALDGFRATGDQRGQGFTLRNLGAVAAGLVDFKAWQEYSQQALKIARQIGDRSDEAEAINHLGHVASYLGDYTSAQRYFGQYLALAREIGNSFQEKMALQNLGWVTNDLKDFAVARDYYEHALIITQAIRDRSGGANSLVGLGDALAGLEKWNAATEAYLAAKELFEGFGSESGVAGSHSGLARVALAQGDEGSALKFVDAILEYLEHNEGILERLRESYLTCVQVLQAVGDPRTAEVLEIAHTKLQDTSEKIEDQAMRRSFLENVPYNRELVKLWEEQQDN